MARRPVYPGLSEHRESRAVSSVLYPKIEAFVESCIVQGLTTSRIYSLAIKEFGCTKVIIDKCIQAVSTKWAKEETVRRPMWKAAAMERMQRAIRKATEESNFAMVARFEGLLAEMQGTKAPIELNVNHTQQIAMVNVILDMTPSDMQEALEEIKELERKAKLLQLVSGNPMVKRHLQVIDTEGSDNDKAANE